MKLTLYKECLIKKNDVIEKTTDYDILTYLKTLTSETIDNINLNKSLFDNLLCEIKINKQLKNIDVYSFNYAMIEYNDYKYFYFIASKEWIADSTTKLVMYLDSCNTYEYRNNIISDTSKWRRANVIREHRDRYDVNRLPIIDRVDEGLGSLPMIVNSTKLLNESINKYYLAFYKAKDENQRYYTQILSTNGIEYTTQFNEFIATYTQYLTKDNDAILVYVNPNKQIYDELKETNVNVFYAYRAGDGVFYSNYSSYFVGAKSIYFKSGFEMETASHSFLSGDNITYILGTHSKAIGAGNTYSFEDLLGEDYVAYTSSGKASQNVIIQSFNDTIKADSNLLKLVEIPYVDINNISFYFNTDLKIFIATLDDDLLSSSFAFNLSDMYSISLPTTLQGVKHSKEYETKLLGSQFTLNQFKYDSFNYNVALEDLDLSKNSFNVECYIPNDMSTNVAFKFDYTGIERNEFDRWLITARNNQVPTMSNEYLDYMQNGYNYDVKNRAIQSAMNWGSFIGNVVSGGIALDSSINASQVANSQLMDLVEVNQNALISNINYLDKHKGLGSAKRTALQNSINSGINSSSRAIGASVANAISKGNIASAITSTIGTLTHNIMYDVQSKNAVEQRKKDYLNSAVNVSGSDDLSLFYAYNGANKLRFSQYKLESNISNSIYEILRYTGYATNEYKIPNLTSRVDYNFIQAYVEFKGDYYIPETMFDDIIESLSNGVTLFHYYYTGATWLYDLERVYENWETILYGDIPTPTELSDLKLTATTYLNTDGTFQKVVYELKNPNDVKVKFVGTIGVDDNVETKELIFAANGSISMNTTVDGYELSINGELTEVQE